MKKPVLLVSLLLSSAAFAAPPSNTIPTSALVAEFQVARSTQDPTQAKADAFLMHAFVQDGKLMVQNLEISADDTIVFSVGNAAVKYDPKSPTMLPYIAGETYVVTFTRAVTGETFGNKVVMPGEVAFSTPDYDHVFKKSEDAVAKWNRATNSIGAMGMIGYNCTALGSSLKISEDFMSLTIPAGAANPCDKDVRIELLVVYLNGGIGYGSFTSASLASSRFFIGAGRSQSSLSLENLRLSELVEQSRASGSKVIRKVLQ